MGIPARAARPLVALAIAAASLGCIAHPAYAENATAAVVSDDGSHIVVDVDLNGGASDSGLKDSTGIDLPSLLNGLISNPDIDADSAENSVE